MTTGEKIKYFRNMRGISQETLGQLSGINSATIKKYEYGIRNPKPDQLLKIANANSRQKKMKKVILNLLRSECPLRIL